MAQNRHNLGPGADAARLSIGALSRATGVPAETLRTWERRYGFPEPVERTPSGHRLYAITMVEALRLAIRAMDRGHKPSRVLGARPSTLSLLADVEPPARAMPPPPGGSAPRGESIVDAWLECARVFDRDGLVHGLGREWDRLGAVPFLDQRAGPFLEALGTAWSAGNLDPSHEHFASEQLREFLNARWRPLGERASAGLVVCATPAGEHHVLGLHMAATVLSLSGFGIVFLGADVPARDASNAAHAVGAVALAVSASSAHGTDRAESYARVLLALLKDTTLLLGGAGFSRDVPGAQRIADCRSLERWARSVAEVGQHGGALGDRR